MKKFLLGLFFLFSQTCVNADELMITMRSADELHAALEEAGFAVFAQRTNIISSLASRTLRPHDILFAFLCAHAHFRSLNFSLSEEDKNLIYEALLNNNQEDLAALRLEEVLSQGVGDASCLGQVVYVDDHAHVPRVEHHPEIETVVVILEQVHLSGSNRNNVQFS